MRLPGGEISAACDRWLAFGGFDEATLTRYITPGLADWALAEPAKPSIQQQADFLLLFDPAQDPGGACLLKCEPDGLSRIISLFPLSRLGATHPVRIQELIFDEDQLDVVLSCNIARDDDPIPISFFDTHFFLNGHSYRVGGECVFDFQLTAFAISARRPHQTSIEMPRPGWADEVGVEPSASGMVTLDLSRLCAWLPGHSGAADLVQFRGEVTNLKRLGSKLFDMPVWHYQVVVSRTGADWPVDFIITEQASGGEPPFELGEYIEGIAWLQGRLADQAR